MDGCVKYTRIQAKSLVQYFCGRLHKISQQILVKQINCHVQREYLVTFFRFSNFTT